MARKSVESTRVNNKIVDILKFDPNRQSKEIVKDIRTFLISSLMTEKNMAETAAREAVDNGSKSGYKPYSKSKIDKFIGANKLREKARQWGKDLKPSDRPWSIGVYKKLNPPISIDTVGRYAIPLQKYLLAHDRFLTVRRFEWYCFLFPFLWKKLFPDNKPTIIGELKLMQIAAFFGQREQAAEIEQGDNAVCYAPDLDKSFIIDKDVSTATIMRYFGDIFLISILAGIRDLNVRETKKQTVRDIVQPLVDDVLPKEHETTFYEFIRMVMEAVKDNEQWESAIDFVTNKHPEIQDAVIQWMVLSTRENLVDLWYATQK